MFAQTALSTDRNTNLRAASAMAAYPVSGSTLKLAKHRSVYRAGDDAERLFEVESGAVMLYRILNDGRRQVVEVVFPGGMCGLTSGEAHQTCAETLVPSVLRSYSKSEIARSDTLRCRIADKLQDQITHLHDHAVSLGRKNAEERVCTLILRLRDLDDANFDTAECSVALPMTRTEIADYLGLTLETVCRTLSDLSRRKFLEVGEKKSEIKVPNVNRLRQLAHCEPAQYA
jgi:CRP/FNR family transcriptional regulator